MGLLHLLIPIAAIFLFWLTQSKLLMIISIIIFIVIFWSYGVMHNFATEAAKKRPSYKGGFYDFTPEELNTVPNWVSAINFISSIIGILLLIISVIILLRK